jgi:hypothetical protein
LSTCTQKVSFYVSSAEGLWKREKLSVRCAMYFVFLRYLLSSELGYCVRVERHVYPRTVVSVG